MRRMGRNHAAGFKAKVAAPDLKLLHANIGQLTLGMIF